MLIKKAIRPTKKSESSLQCSEEAEKAFLDAEKALAEATLLKHPISVAPLSLWTDASLFAIGSSLNQLSNEIWEPIAFFSMKLSKSQTNWSTYDRELLAIYSSIKKFRHMLEGTFSLPDARFSHINTDFSGLLPPSDGYTYCMTIIDRFTRWPEVIPTTNIAAETTCKALIHDWIPRFGCPVTITTDQGRNFDSHLFRHLNDILGTNRIRTTSYHPQSNGLVERFHRHLESSIIVHSQPKWTETFPIVLLVIRSVIKPDINATCAELTCGTTLRLPSDILNSKSDLSTPTDT
ncbi:Gag-Pol polyprotein [Araneus ventricosus]|uniref:Gag-Pol polyprotein n=1 Tax=Araneus ventricosus TaxID=182803 RepID=A0A4Y2LN55_ARAVE|nr:Gag-Pol polyprotein [Araneus ventricosus]